MNSDNVKEYFQILEQYVEKVEKANGHKLRGDEILNIDETGFDLSNCSKTLRVVIKPRNTKGTADHNIRGLLIEHIFQQLYVLMQAAIGIQPIIAVWVR